MTNNITYTWNIWWATLDGANEYKVYFCKDFNNILVWLRASWSANLTVKIFTGIDPDNIPNPTAAISATNQFAYTQSINLADNTSIDGATWIAYAGASDWYTQYAVNVSNNPVWVWIHCTARSAWQVDVSVNLWGDYE